MRNFRQFIEEEEGNPSENPSADPSADTISAPRFNMDSLEEIRDSTKQEFSYYLGRPIHKDRLIWKYRMPDNTVVLYNDPQRSQKNGIEPSMWHDIAKLALSKHPYAIGELEFNDPILHRIVSQVSGQQSKEYTGGGEQGEPDEVFSMGRWFDIGRTDNTSYRAKKKTPTPSRQRAVTTGRRGWKVR